MFIRSVRRSWEWRSPLFFPFSPSSSSLAFLGKFLPGLFLAGGRGGARSGPAFFSFSDKNPFAVVINRRSLSAGRARSSPWAPSPSFPFFSFAAAGIMLRFSRQASFSLLATATGQKGGRAGRRPSPLFPRPARPRLWSLWEWTGALFFFPSRY